MGKVKYHQEKQTRKVQMFVQLIVFLLTLLDGKAVMSKELFETLDDKNHLVIYKVIGGILKEMYKSFKFTIQAIPKGEGSLVHWTMEYEKLNADDPDASSMLQFCVSQSKDVDAHLALE